MRCRARRGPTWKAPGALADPPPPLADPTGRRGRRDDRRPGARRMLARDPARLAARRLRQRDHEPDRTDHRPLGRLLGGRPAGRHPDLGTDPLVRHGLPEAQGRRPAPRAAPVPRAAGDHVRDPADHHGRRADLLHGARHDREPGHLRGARHDRAGHRQAVELGLQLRRRRRVRHRPARAGGRRDRRPGGPADAVPARGRAGRVRPRLPRRHPLVLGAGLPLQAGHDPGAHQHVPGRPAGRGRVRRQVRRALRRGALVDAVQREGRVARGVRRAHRRAAGRRPGRPARARLQPPAGRPLRLLRHSRGELMAATVEAVPGLAPRRQTLGRTIVKWVTSTDHKTIGYMYLITAFVWFAVGGIMALLIGAPDVAFPRLNAFSYWLYLFGGLIAAGGFLTPQGAASFGWFAYAPLSNSVYSPGAGGDLWVFGLALTGFGTILGAVNFITTIVTMRAPGMTMFRMPIFTWNTLVTSLLVLMAFPPLAAAIL